jgi:GAF domain-containing protein
LTPMEPIPETAEALDELDSAYDAGLRLRRLQELANGAKARVPELVGVSLARLEHELTFTLVATSTEFSVLDGVQYADGGPCVDSAHAEEVREFTQDDVLDEERWRLFAEATAAHNVRSTLTLPVVRDGEVVGTVNLYAATKHAFVGHHDELAEIFGAWAAGAITNADLSFTTRLQAAATPERVRIRGLIDVAAAIVAVTHDVDLDEAEGILYDAAARAGVEVVELARQIVAAQDGGAEPPA